MYTGATISILAKKEYCFDLIFTDCIFLLFFLYIFVVDCILMLLALASHTHAGVMKHALA